MEKKENLGSSGTKNDRSTFKPMSKADKRLVKKAVGGNPEAMNKVIGLYYKDILYFAAKKVGVQEAEDIAQQAISKIVDRLETLREPEKVKSWMMKIVRDSCIDYMRRDILENKRFSSMDAVEKSNFEAEESKREVLPEEALEDVEMRKQVIESLDALPDNYADAMRLYYLDELDYDEIAHVLDINRRKVKNDLYNARILFRKHFEETSGVQVRFAAAPAAAIPVLTQILHTDCDQLVTPAALERISTFTKTAVENKYGVASTITTIGTFSWQPINTLLVKAGVSAVAIVAAGSLAMTIIPSIDTDSQPEGQAIVSAENANFEPETITEGSVETLEDMIGVSEAATLDSFAQSGVNEETWRIFLSDIGAIHYNSAYEYDFTYEVYILEKQEKQLMLAERKNINNGEIRVVYQFGVIEDLPRMAKVALMFG